MLTTAQVAAALDGVSADLGKASTAFDRYRMQHDRFGEGNAEWFLEKAFLTLMTLAEALQLPLLRTEIAGVFSDARAEGLVNVVHDPDGEEYQKWSEPAGLFVEALKTSLVTESSRTVTKDLESILRAAAYSITKRKGGAFRTNPKNEKDVHVRLEAILKCMFEDLRHKPTLAKPIKNFIPDTGIPSIQTLIEYKFLKESEQVGKVADEILADTRGYNSPEWKSFIYVIYETSRFRPEYEWHQLLRSSGVLESTSLVVISGA